MERGESELAAQRKGKRKAARLETASNIRMRAKREIQRRYRQQGTANISALSREFGFDRKTIRTYLREVGRIR